MPKVKERLLEDIEESLQELTVILIQRKKCNKMLLND